MVAAPPTSDLETDRRLMAAALALGRRNLGLTHPAPAVGALVVRNGDEGPEIVGRGHTAPGGYPHAEVQALAEAGEKARGATVYVTLEPSPVREEGPSDADQLIAAGVARVVSALEDPDPRSSGRGHAMLRDAGLAVTTGVLGEEARRAHAGHLLRIAAGRPQVTLKLAVSADGMIGRTSGERMLVSGRETFERLQAMRIESDAILIGINTALVNDPRLVVRIPGITNRRPVRVVLDSEARLPVGSNLVKTVWEAPLWVVVGPDAPVERCQALEAAGATVLPVGGGTGGVDTTAVLKLLAERGITRLLVEGGAKVASSFVALGLVDEVVLFRAPVVVGPDGVRALAGRALSAIERSPRYRLAEEARLGDDRMMRYERTS